MVYFCYSTVMELQKYIPVKMSIHLHTQQDMSNLGRSKDESKLQ